MCNPTQRSLLSIFINHCMESRKNTLKTMKHSSAIWKMVSCDVCDKWAETNHSKSSLESSLGFFFLKESLFHFRFEAHHCAHGFFHHFLITLIGSDHNSRSHTQPPTASSSQARRVKRLKEQFTHKFKFIIYSPPMPDGKSIKHFWSFTKRQ